MMPYKGKNPYQNPVLKIGGYKKAMLLESKNPYQNTDLKKEAKGLLAIIFDTLLLLYFIYNNSNNELNERER